MTFSGLYNGPVQSSAKIIILDDDELIFGLSQVGYEVHEDDGAVSIGVSFTHGIPGDYTPLLLLSTSNGTAKDGTDFIALSSSAITFAGSRRIDSLNILIIPGSSTEDSEVFTVTLDAVILTHAGNDTILNLSEEERARLIKNPRMANVTIIDNNVAIIGFLNTTVKTVEGRSNWLNFSIGVIQGYLDIHVTVNFTTEDVTAQAGSDYQKTISSLVIVGDSILSISVKIFNDERSESPELFYGHLSVAKTPSPNILLKPVRAIATIIDNEEDTTSKTTEAVIVTGVVISAGVITFVIAAMVVSHVVLKKKCGKKEQHQASPEHTYESIPLPTEVSHGSSIQQEPDRTTSIVDEDETVKYDDLVSCQNVQESCNDIPLRANEAYTSFNISAEPNTDL